jgi:hypothetical protein
LARAVVRTDAHEFGRSYHLRPDAQAFRAAAEWIALERQCCPFLTFEMVWEPGAAGPTINIGGPEGTREFLAAELPELPAESA